MLYLLARRIGPESLDLALVVLLLFPPSRKDAADQVFVLYRMVDLVFCNL